MKCISILLICSVFWSISPIMYKYSGITYNKGNIFESIFIALFGLLIGGCGTALFIYSTTICKELSNSILYTFSIPIILTTIGSIIVYNEKLTYRKSISIILILYGLYLVSN